MADISFEYKIETHLNEEFLRRVVDEANFPSGKILLVLNDEPLLDDHLGECIPKKLLKYAPDVRVFDQYKKQDWDCGIAVSEKACDLREQLPAYFTHTLGHELGHAYVCLANVDLHIHCCLIHSFICEASNGKITQPSELPDEELFDKFGVYVAERLFSRKELNAQINQRIKMLSSKNTFHFEKMISLSGSSNFGNLRDSLIDFSMPYKDKLLELWRKDVVKRGSNALASEIDDLDALFE